MAVMAVKTVEDLRGYCRVCLEQPQSTQMMDMNVIFDEEAKFSYYDCFEICTKFNLRLCDGNEPYTMCKRCGVELQWAYDFYRKVGKANERLRIMREKTVVKVKVEMKPETQYTAQETQMELFTDEEDLVEEVVPFVSDEEFLLPEQTDTELPSELEPNSGKTAAATIAIDQMEHMQLSESALSACGFYSETNSEANEFQSDDETVTFTFTSAEDVVQRQRYVGQASCQYCKKNFANRSSMIKHQLIHQTDRPKYKCSHCDSVYSTNQALNIHVSTKHERSGSTCEICGKVYAIAKGLEIHMRYHNQDFPFKCDQCERKFAQRSHLTLHKLVQHRNARFLCKFPNCGKNFTSSSALRNHECLHSKMPFECSDCQQGYPSRAKLRVHIKRKHDKDVTMEELDDMRKFRVPRSKLLLSKVDPKPKE